MNKVNSNFKNQLSSLKELVFDTSRQNELLLEFLKIEEKSRISDYHGDDVLLKKFIVNSSLEDCDCNCDNEDCECKDDEYDLDDLDDLYDHLKINIEGIDKMNRLLLYNSKNTSTNYDEDIAIIGDKFGKLQIYLEAIKCSMDKYKEMKREEMDKEENKGEDLIEYFRKADRLKRIKSSGLLLRS